MDKSLIDVLLMFVFSLLFSFLLFLFISNLFNFELDSSKESYNIEYETDSYGYYVKDA